MAARGDVTCYYGNQLLRILLKHRKYAFLFPKSLLQKSDPLLCEARYTVLSNFGDMCTRILPFLLVLLITNLCFSSTFPLKICNKRKGGGRNIKMGRMEWGVGILCNESIMPVYDPYGLLHG